MLLVACSQPPGSTLAGDELVEVVERGLDRDRLGWLADYAAAWREGEIEDTPQNAREAIEALALREAMQPSALSA